MEMLKLLTIHHPLFLSLAPHVHTADRQWTYLLPFAGVCCAADCILIVARNKTFFLSFIYCFSFVFALNAAKTSAHTPTCDGSAGRRVYLLTDIKCNLPFSTQTFLLCALRCNGVSLVRLGLGARRFNFQHVYDVDRLSHRTQTHTAGTCTRPNTVQQSMQFQMLNVLMCIWALS